MGPGEYLVLLTADCTALWGWRKFRSLDDQEGVNCSVFRYEKRRPAGGEKPLLASRLIGYAHEFAARRWPDERRYYTYVNPRAVRSPNPGYCYLMAGYRRCGETSKGLLIFEYLVEDRENDDCRTDDRGQAGIARFRQDRGTPGRQVEIPEANDDPRSALLYDLHRGLPRQGVSEERLRSLRLSLRLPTL